MTTTPDDTRLSNMPKLLNSEQACLVLSCSRSHFYSLVNSGAIPAGKCGLRRGIRVTREDCEAYMRNWRYRK